MTQTQLIIKHLKTALHEKGLTYAQFAKRLNLSEITIKRIFSYKSSLTLDKIEELCEALDLDLFEVIKQVKIKSTNKKQHLTLEQEKTLDKNPKLLVFFYSLLGGISPEKIVTNYNISANESQKYLIELDRLGLIYLETNNKFKILASPFVEWSEHGPLNQKYEKDLRTEFLNSMALKPNEWFLFKKAYLTKESLKLIRRQQEEVLAKIKEYSEFDRSTQPDRCESTTFLFAARNWIPSSILKYKRPT